MGFGMIVFFIMSGIGLWLFIKRERKAEEPLIDLLMFKSVDFTAKRTRLQVWWLGSSLRITFTCQRGVKLWVV